MDALDLTTGERLSGHKFLPKGSRRKATAPQRRQHSDEENCVDSAEKCDEKSDTSSMEDADNNSPGIETPPRPSSEGDVRQLELVALQRDSKPIFLTRHAASQNVLGDFAQKFLQARQKLIQSGSVALEQHRHFPLNLNNNSNSPADSAEVNAVDSAGSHSDLRPQSVVRELPFSLLTSSRGLTMDDLMQQRLRRYLDDVQPAEAPGIPERTKKQNRWAFNVWREWARKRNALEDSFVGPYKGVPLDVGQASEEELDYWLCKFVVEIRRKDGHPYPPHTLMQIVMGIQRYLRQQAGKPAICILDRSNSTYASFRSVLDFRIKELTDNGATSMKSGSRATLYRDVDAKYRRYLNREPFPSAIDRSDRDLFDWRASVMNTDTAQGLLNAVFWNNYKTFGIQYIDDHWNLRAENFQIHSKCENGDPPYLEFIPSVASVISSGGKSNGMRVLPKTIYSDSLIEREIFTIYQKYLAHIPNSGPFYRHPVDPTIVDRSIKFSDQWVGKNRLRAMLKHLIDIGSASRLKPSYNAPSRHSSSPGVDSFITPMMQLTSHTPRFGSPSLRENTETTKPLLCNQQANSSATKEMDDASFEDADSNPPSPKRKKLENSAEPKSATTSSKGSNSKASNTSLDDAALEIAVPKTITSITVIKGSRKITFHLE